MFLSLRHYTVVSFELEAFDDDRCVELEIKSADLRDGMSLADHVRVKPTRVTRRITWEPYTVLSDGSRVPTSDPELDRRERVTTTCFHAQDGYESSSGPAGAGAMHCVEVVGSTRYFHFLVMGCMLDSQETRVSEWRA